MTTQTFVPINQIPELTRKAIEFLKEENEQASNEVLLRHAEEIVFFGVHETLQELKESKLYLWKPRNKDSIDSFPDYYTEDKFKVYKATKTKPEIKARQKILDYFPNNHIAKKIVAALNDWDSSFTSHKTKTCSFHQKKFSVYTFEFPLVAHYREAKTPYYSPDMLVAAWRFRLQLLIPLTIKNAEHIDLLPIIRLQIIDSIVDDTIKEIDIHFFKTIRACLDNYVEEILNSLNIEDDTYPPLLFKTEIYFQKSQTESAERFSEWYKTSFPDDNYIHHDSNKKPTICTVTTSPPPLEDSPSPREIIKPLNETNADIVLLNEFEISDMVLMPNGFVYTVHMIDIAKSFVTTNGCTPKQLLNFVRYKESDLIKKIKESNGYEYFSDLELCSGVDKRIIIDAVYASKIPKGTGKSPKVLLLTNLTNQHHKLHLSWNNASTEEFLNVSLFAIERLNDSEKPILKVASTLLKKNLNIELWAKKNDVRIINPTSGFDSGIHLVKHWKHSIGTLFLVSEYREIVSGNPTLEAFNEYCSTLSLALNGLATEDDLERIYYFELLPDCLKAIQH